MADLDIKIGTASDTKGAADAKKAIQEVREEANRLGQAFKEGGGGLGGLKALGQEVKGIYTEAGGGIKGLFSVITTSGTQVIGVLSAITASLATARKALNEYAKGEEGVLRLQAALAANGQLTEKNNERYQKLAKTLKAATGESFVDVLRSLTQAGSTSETIERDAKAVEDFAGITGDLETASVAVAKALQGHFELFNRWGVYVDENASKTERLDQLYQQLAQRGAGQLRAAHQGLTGQAKDLDNAWHSLWKNIGYQIAQTGVAQYALSGLAGTVGFFAKLIGGVVPVQENFRNSLVKTTNATIDAERFNRQYADSLKEIEKYATAVNDALERGQKIKEETRKHEDEQTDSKMALDLAIVDRLEKTGAIAPEQAIQSRAVIREKSASEKFQRDRQARVGSMQYLQAQVDSKMDEIQKAEEEARGAESQVISEDEIGKKRVALKSKLDAEVSRWEQDYAALRASPWDYSNPEIGEKAGPRTEADMARAEGKITPRLLAARAAREQQMAQFEATFPATVAGSRERALQARALATEITQRNYGQINGLASQIESLGGEQQSADVRERYRVKTAAIQAGTDVFGANPNVNTAGVESTVARSSQALQGKFDNLGAVISGGFETMGAALQDVLIRVKRAEDQIKRQRN